MPKVVNGRLSAVELVCLLHVTHGGGQRGKTLTVTISQAWPLAPPAAVPPCVFSLSKGDSFLHPLVCYAVRGLESKEDS